MGLAEIRTRRILRGNVDWKQSTESRAYSVFNQSSGGFICNGRFYKEDAVAVAFVRWNFLLPAAKKSDNNAAKFIVSLKTS